MKTLRDKFIQALTQLGEIEVKRTNKYIVYTRKAGGQFYIGRSGSLRIGHTSATSIPITLKRKLELLESVK